MPLVGPPERQKSSWTNAGVGMSQGWTILAELGAIIGLFAFAGYWLDRLFGTKPVLFAVMMIVGYAGGVLHVIVYIRGRAAAEERAKTERQ
jgi:F0F1-type ATP synthase assembly protein I